MNDTVNIIRNRRSIRQFKQRQIPNSELQTIMECAILAPNGMNAQQWHFSVIQNKELLKRMANITKENMANSGIELFADRAKDPKFNCYYNAPTVVFVTADEKWPVSQIDASLAAENILIAAEANNIGSCIMTSTEFLFASDKGKACKREMGIPDGYAHVVTIALGYKAGETPVAPPRNKDVINYIK
ncbi:MAG TPA: nitroreductase family protein [Dehalococcoidia bacterium]|nr:nitroreductase family protein [Dehalococcoidia bacterium]